MPLLLFTPQLVPLTPLFRLAALQSLPEVGALVKSLLGVTIPMVMRRTPSGL